MLNKFICIGRWSKDVDLKYTSSGKAVASSSIAINERYGDNDNTTFLPVVMWGKTAENTAQYSGKGRMVAIEGRIQVRSWDSDNGRRYATEVVADNVKFLDRAESNDRQQQGSGQSGRDPFAGDGKPIDISDDDLPF
ncbi:single-stranded DNA-binding protein [Paenibacillus sabinae]|uniref:Single-stranded DNA-binding protein n=1 Tax=Paenibacillus sabinae T27 TaxID=1268072 RepID=X4ZWN4_9BACL|nr:single-stranded DNA-binding protein [Paenibacillus sabinae]AHV96124.1 single-stranded DNA-binding protein [Paenibacillus sabinae T27]